ncbi:MAG: hypothetical protein WA777_19835, partial [Rhodanobacter sp.]
MNRIICHTLKRIRTACGQRRALTRRVAPVHQNIRYFATRSALLSGLPHGECVAPLFTLDTANYQPPKNIWSVDHIATSILRRAQMMRILKLQRLDV